MDIEHYDRNIFRSLILKEDLKSAMAYIGQFPEKKDLYDKYISLFQEENYLAYDVDADLSEILLIYQKYYRDVFYLSRDETKAAAQMRNRFAEWFKLDCMDAGISFDDMEEGPITKAFLRRGFHFLGGKTCGHYGPYIWKDEEIKHYMVKLPDGIQDYAVKFLDNFISKSWMDYLSFGEISTGGWSNGDGLIHCIRAGYDLESESFQVSLLKHEAQHTMDLAKYKDMTSGDLEYRAKLVELIYSNERDLLGAFAEEADSSKPDNGHAFAASRIIKGFEACFHLPYNKIQKLPAKDVQNTAAKLFEKSNKEIARKYG